MDDKVSENAAVNLQKIVEQERAKRIQAEEMSKALVEEFTGCNDFDDVRQKFKEKIKEIAPQALINVVELMNTAESESVRSSLNKWVLEWTMNDKIDGTKDDIANLLKELGKDKNATEPTNVD